MVNSLSYSHNRKNLDAIFVTPLFLSSKNVRKVSCVRKRLVRDHSFSMYVELSEKLAFLTP